MLIILSILLLCLVLSGIIYYFILRKEDSFSWPFIFVLFSGKVAAGCLFGYIYKRFYNGDDTWMLNHDSWLQYQRMLSHPWLFISEVFSKEPIVADRQFFFHFENYLQNLEYSIITKVMAPFNFISHGNYYVNIVFFCFLTFWGSYLFCLLLARQFNCNKKNLAVIVFLFPPAAFWLSGLRGEGWLMLFTGTLLYYFQQWLSTRTIYSFFVCTVSFGMLFILRNGFALLLLPALIGWWLSSRYQLKNYQAFGAVYGLTAGLVFLGRYLLPPRYDLLKEVITRQQEFLELHGNTQYHLTPLQESAGSFLAVLPEALVNVFIRPYPWEAKGVLQWLVVVENFVVILLVLWVLIKFSPVLKSIFGNPLAWTLVCFATSLYLFIGYTVPFPGAIARYRIIAELIVVSLLSVCCIKSINIKKN